MSYSFRFSFPKSLVSSGLFIEDQEEKKRILLIEEPYLVTLFSCKKDVSLLTSDWLVVQGREYNSAAVAESDGHRIKNALMVTFAKHGIGADFSVEWCFISKKEQQRLEDLKVIHQIDGNVLVFEDDPEITFISVKGSAKAATPSGEFVKTFLVSLALSPSLSEREQLAYRVFNIALFQPDPLATFLFLVMVIEALSDYAPRSEVAIAHVDMLIESTKNNNSLTKEDSDSMIGALRWLKQESIRQAGKRLVAERLGNRMYADMSAAKYFSECYDLRSSLVHRGSYDREKFNKLSSHLPHFVSDLLTLPILGPPDKDSTHH